MLKILSIKKFNYFKVSSFKENITKSDKCINLTSNFNKITFFYNHKINNFSNIIKENAILKNNENKKLENNHKIKNDYNFINNGDIKNKKDINIKEIKTIEKFNKINKISKIFNEIFQENIEEDNKTKKIIEKNTFLELKSESDTNQIINEITRKFVSF